jgi:CRP-like cAMP-binding protein
VLPQAELENGSNGLEHVQLPLRDVLYEPNEPIEDVYFLLKGVASLVNEPTPGNIVEFATVGHEGMVGLPVLLGANTISSRAIVQVPGEALRMKATRFRDLVDRYPSFSSILMRYTLALMNQIAQSTSCNRLHEVQERCARWLFQTHDRVEGESFPLTQEFLGQMLGVQRATVSIAARMLQQAGLISYSRGMITVLDRNGLEQASCECYRVIKTEYDKLRAMNPSA